MTLPALKEVVAFDVDDTLVLWGQSVEGVMPVAIQTEWGTVEHLTPNPRAIEAIIEHYVKGDYILVWSQAGREWAVRVVDALGLKGMVHQILTKPARMYDDCPPSSWTQVVDLCPK